MTQRLTSVDALYAATQVLHGVWFFESKISTSKLRRTLEVFALKYPIFGSTLVKGRSNDVSLHGTSPFTDCELAYTTTNGNTNINTIFGSVPLIHSHHDATSIHYDQRHHHHPDHLNNYLHLVPATTQEDIWSGKRPVLEIKLSTFTSSSVLGVTLSHGVSDGCGLHLMMSEIGRLYGAENENENNEDVGPEFELITSRECIQQMRTDDATVNTKEKNNYFDGTDVLQQNENGKELKLTGIYGNMLWWCLRNIDGYGRRRNRPTRSKVTWSNLSWHNTGHALQDLLLSTPNTSAAMSETQTSSNAIPCVRIRTTIDLRSLNVGIPLNYIGNAIEIVDIIVPRYDIADGWRRMKKTLQEKPSLIVQKYVDNMKNLEDGKLGENVLELMLSENDEDLLLVAEKGWDKLVKVEETVIVNSSLQMTKNTEQYNFGDHRCVYFIPGVSDHIHFVSAMDDKGVDCLLNLPHLQRKMAGKQYI